MYSIGLAFIMDSLSEAPVFQLVLFLAFILSILWLVCKCSRNRKTSIRTQAERSNETPKRSISSPSLGGSSQRKKVRTRKTSFSGLRQIRRIDDEVRTTMTSLLQHFHAKDQDTGDDAESQATFMTNIFPCVTSSDVSVNELETNILCGLDIPCIVEDSKRIIVAYRKKN